MFAVGERVRKDFDESYGETLYIPCDLRGEDDWVWADGTWIGVICEVNKISKYALVKYSDGDTEEMDAIDVESMLYQEVRSIFKYFLRTF